MAWNTPRTWSVGETVTVNFMNAQLRDNWNVLTTNVNTTLGQLNAVTTTEFDSLATLSRVLNSNVTAASNSGTGETDLISYSVPGGTLGSGSSAPFNSLRITAWGSATNSANAKTVRQYFGGSIAANSLTVSAAVGWMMVSTISKVDGSTVQILTTYFSGSTAAGGDRFVNVGQVSRTLSNAQTAKITGQGGASNEVTGLGQIVEFLAA